MNLREAFEAMRPEHRPDLDIIDDRFVVGSYNDWRVPTSIAESAICWAMLKALADGGYEPMFARYGVCLGQIVYDDIHHAYAAAFPPTP